MLSSSLRAILKRSASRRILLGNRRFEQTTASTSEEDPSEGPPPVLRPDLDFDFLLDDRNVDAIRQNIRERKGVGDIDAVRAKWSEIQKFMGNEKKEDGLTETKYKKIWDEFYDAAVLIPNMSDPKAPKGDETTAKEIASWGEKRQPKEGEEFATAEKLVKPWRALLSPTDVAGERSYTLLGPLAYLERALLDYAFERMMALGFKPVYVSDLITKHVTQGCGVMQRSEHGIQYTLSDFPHTALSGTAEMGIASFLRGRTFKEDQLPIRLVAVSRCYRPEISGSASEAKLYRVHEFNKVEMFSVCNPLDSENELNALVEMQRKTYEPLGLHCRQLEMPTEELGAAAARKIDIEAWMPGRKLYGEVCSASNTTDYQARRLNIKYKTSSGETRHVHTCNGTALAAPRTMIALLETYQTGRKDALELPEILKMRLTGERQRPLKFAGTKSLV